MYLHKLFTKISNKRSYWIIYTYIFVIFKSHAKTISNFCMRMESVPKLLLQYTTSEVVSISHAICAVVFIVCECIHTLLYSSYAKLIAGVKK